MNDFPHPDTIPELAAELGWPEDIAALMARVASSEESRRAWQALNQAKEPPARGAIAEAEYQAALAILDTHRNPADFVEFRWKCLRRLVGPMLPKDLIVITAATGAGKTTFALNLLNHFVGIRLPTTYVGLEQDPEQLRSKWAANRLKLDPDLVLSNDWAGLGPDAREAVHADLAWQVTPMKGAGRLAFFSAKRFVDRTALRELVKHAVEWRCRVMIVDHIHRIRHGNGDPFQEFSETVRTAKELAAEHRLVMIVMAQMNRGERDAVKRLLVPPVLGDIRGGGTIEEEADLVLALTRLPRRSLSKEDIAAFRQGKLDPHELLEPNAMGVTCLKHRRRGKALGHRRKLWVHDGHIEEPAWQYDWEAGADRAVPEKGAEA